MWKWVLGVFAVAARLVLRKRDMGGRAVKLTAGYTYRLQTEDGEWLNVRTNLDRTIYLGERTNIGDTGRWLRFESVQGYMGADEILGAVEAEVSPNA